MAGEIDDSVVVADAGILNHFRLSRMFYRSPVMEMIANRPLLTLVPLLNLVVAGWRTLRFGPSYATVVFVLDSTSARPIGGLLIGRSGLISKLAVDHRAAGGTVRATVRLERSAGSLLRTCEYTERLLYTYTANERIARYLENRAGFTQQPSCWLLYRARLGPLRFGWMSRNPASARWLRPESVRLLYLRREPAVAAK